MPWGGVAEGLACKFRTAVRRAIVCTFDFLVAIFLGKTASFQPCLHGVRLRFEKLYADPKAAEGYAKSSVAQLRRVLSRSLQQETEYNRITQRALTVLTGEFKEQYKQYLLESLPY